MEAVFQEEIAAEKERGRTILLSSHIMSEVEALADRVSIIRQGKIIETGTLADSCAPSRAYFDFRYHSRASQLAFRNWGH